MRSRLGLLFLKSSLEAFPESDEYTSVIMDARALVDIVAAISLNCWASMVLRLNFGLLFPLSSAFFIP